MALTQITHSYRESPSQSGCKSEAPWIGRTRVAGWVVSLPIGRGAGRKNRSRRMSERGAGRKMLPFVAGDLTS